MTSQAEFFLSFPLWRAVLEMFAGIFLDEQVRASKKVQQEFFKSKKRGETKKCGKNICDTLSCGS